MEGCNRWGGWIRFDMLTIEMKKIQILMPNKRAFKSLSQMLDYQYTSHISVSPLSKVPCSHAVATAKAAVSDSPNGHTRALREFATLNPKDAEEGAHQIFKKYGLTSSSWTKGQKPRKHQIAKKKWNSRKFPRCLILGLQSGDLI